MRPDDALNPPRRARILLAKTGLDGHWRGVSVVAAALRDAGFEVIIAGMVRGEEVAQAAVDEGVDLVGLSVGGHVKVVEEIVASLRAVRPELPIFAGGVVPPWAKRRLEANGVPVYPPGSGLPEIVAAARQLTEASP